MNTRDNEMINDMYQSEPYLFIEQKDAAVTEVDDIVEPNLADSILESNQYVLLGNMEVKNKYGGSYEYKIGKDGIITERNFKHSTKEESVQEEPAKEEISTTTKKKESSSTSFDDSQQQAINAVLTNSGLEQDDVSDITCSFDSNTNQYTVTFVLNDVKNTSIVDANTFTVISTILG